MKRRTFKITLTVFLILLCVSFLGYGFYRQSLKGYLEKNIAFESELAEALKIFEYNQSQHHDPVPGCWYDSGDYLVFLPRNAEAVFYLSLAYAEAKSDEVKSDLKKVIDQQLPCLEAMLKMNYKQFRDQATHGIHLPPLWNETFYLSQDHFFEAGESGDVLRMLALIDENLGEPEKAEIYKAQAHDKNRTISANCCEQGPLVLSDEKWQGLQGLANDSPDIPEDIWGAQFSSLYALDQNQGDKLKGLFGFIQKQWEGGKNPFLYLGGNYDVAGTIALERLYAKKTGDESFKPLSDKLYAYLMGENEFHYRFTQSDYIYHPCYFFQVCHLEDTLINGPNEKNQTTIQKTWQNAEVQLVGQAEYVLMKVLYLDL